MMSSLHRKRLLLVAHNFPPLGSGGVHRPVKFARYLSDYGWDTEILTVKDIRYHAYDGSLLDEIPEIPIHRTGSCEPLRLNWVLGWRPPAPAAPVITGFADLEKLAAARPTTASRGARIFKGIVRRIMIPDYEFGWVPFALARGRALGRARSFDAILTTSPPESAHFIGWGLRRHVHARWVADFRDAWSSHHLKQNLGPINQYINRAMEKAVLKAADGIIANTESMARSFRGRGVNAPVLTLPNGFDEGDRGDPLPKDDPRTFTIVHNGSFRGGRRALAVMRGFSEARRRDAAFAALAKLYLIGINRDDDIRAAGELGLGNSFFGVGYIRHRDALRACAGADLLVLVMAETEGPALVPGKLYEYLGIGKPIMALLPPGEAAEVLARTTAGAIVVPPADTNAMAEGFLSSFAAWRSGNTDYTVRTETARPYSRREQVRALADFLNTL